MLSTKIVGLALFSAAAAVTAVAAPALAAQPHQAPATTAVVLDCAGQAQTQPGTFLVACGDGNNYLSGLHWTDWGSATATATGTDNANDCTPNCAAGAFHQFPATVTLTKPEPWAGHPGSTRYTELDVHYTGARPTGLPADLAVHLIAPPA
ncbi:hypothetical protein [Streptacidiphilus melanogenes]|uniref:hypothetical protein n=1 Tax=Streptacidiphilus melanogenes TaxID=411235 RepID=UPI0005A6633E|nr:hypothetical protein [Streptacidiphilus melanogenes]